MSIDIIINNQEIGNLIGFPIITQSKSYMNIPVNLDETSFTIRDDNGSFFPLSSNSFIDPVYENNTVEIFDGSTQLYGGIINDLIPDRLNEKIIKVDCRTILQKFIKNKFNYKTEFRGDGTIVYPVGEYELKGDGFYYETPAHALWHYMQGCGWTDFININSIEIIHAIFESANVWIQIDTDFPQLWPHEILNYLCIKFHIFIYVDDNGLITLIHNQDLSNAIQITQEIDNSVFTGLRLDRFTDYSIELIDGTFRTATDNSDYGLQYRDIFKEPFEILKGMIYIYDTITADYLGQMSIDIFNQSRQSINLNFDMEVLGFNLEKGISVTTPDRAWNNKLFEPYILIRDYNTRLNIVESYNVL